MKTPVAHSTMRAALLSGLLALVGLAAAAPAEASDPSPDAARQLLRGRIAFLRCAACHSLQPGEPHKTGPNLAGVLDQPAARHTDFSYTAGLRQSGLQWDAATLRRWISKPSDLVPATSMAYANTLGEAELDALIAYLASLRPAAAAAASSANPP